mmetsp:Transcript_32966/g.90929  ORF Transcript_32966/g.90929 Transcript_32966/m.90929 type:complete len:198 (-) Transcript_32966:160-753(-)
MGKIKQTRRKLAQFFNWRVSVTLTDGRVLVGVLMAVDKHVNLVLCNTEEYRRYKVRGKPEGKELKRMLGFIVLRGRGVLYVQPEEVGKDEFVEPEKVKKTKAVAKAAAPKAVAVPAGGAAMPTLPGLPGLGRPPAGLPNLSPGLLAGLPGVAGMRPPLLGMPGMAGLPGMGTLPGFPGLPKMPGLGGLPIPALPKAA